MDDSDKIDYIGDMVYKEINKKLKLYNVDFYSDEYSKFMGEIINTELSNLINTIYHEKISITNKFIRDSIDKILKPYRLLFDVLQTSKKKNYLKKDDIAFKQYSNILDMIIEGKSITESCKILAENNYNKKTEKYVLGDWQNIKRRFNKFRKTHNKEIYWHITEKMLHTCSSAEEYHKVFKKVNNKLFGTK